MSLIYVTGAPGAGKSTLQNELRRRGYVTRDIDDPEFGGAYNKASNAKVTIPPADLRTPEWFEAHEWRVHHDAFDNLKADAADKDIILFGVAASDGEIIHVFDKILYLQIDNETLTRRLRTRIDNDYAKNDFELNEILERKAGLDRKYSSQEIIKIDASQTLNDVANKIVALI